MSQRLMEMPPSFDQSFLYYLDHQLIRWDPILLEYPSGYMTQDCWKLQLQPLGLRYHPKRLAGLRQNILGGRVQRFYQTPKAQDFLDEHLHSVSCVHSFYFVSADFQVGPSLEHFYQSLHQYDLLKVLPLPNSIFSY
ncbi:hypothetical protein RAE21_19300 [Rhodoferax sp. TBRC 17198]|uniref:hypothetical protein n=1 Tax=Rhodoferax potami TaxID=3068338 RepID=UPI0028BEE4EA|nr:hypothetical protein [Rhodoferax sp. TBRC 17198]MDT7524487.1 hypothetical protein [Rhodoferax sp. TBRC 17198]